MELKTFEAAIEHMDTLKSDELLFSMGPQHPSTHGVLRLLVKSDGEVVREVTPILGYLHRSIEKNSETMTYLSMIPCQDRIDYVSAMFNEVASCMGTEKLVGIEVPERAEWIRVIMCELQRLASHFLWLGSFGLDLGASSLFMYCFRDREKILEMFENVTGQRLLYVYMRPGGVRNDVTPEFMRRLYEFVKTQPPLIDEYEELFTGNAILRNRLIGIGVLTKEMAINFGCSGPMLRGSGVQWDIRKNDSYSAYHRFDWEVPVFPEGDCYARYKVRLMEMRQSIRILEQAMEGLPEGDYTGKVPKVIKPSRGDCYVRIESPRGEMGVFMASDGSKMPARVHFRSPSFVNLSAIGVMAPGHLIADLIAILGSIDIVLGDVDR